MTDKNGIYLSVDCDNAVRVIIENGTKIQTDRLRTCSHRKNVI